MASIITKAPPKPRPMYLNLVQIRLPLPGILSIMHRISGAVLFLCLPAFLWLLDRSLDTEVGYDFVREVVLANWMVKVVLAGLLWGFMHHFCAGIRYLFLDMHMGIDLKSARKSAAVVYFVSIPLTLVAVWLLLF
jgi:succinate dehydrogenase / fumarate reductase, cytochrome b subunit